MNALNGTFLFIHILFPNVLSQISVQFLTYAFVFLLELSVLV